MHSERLAMRAVLGSSWRVFGAALPALTIIAAGTAAALVGIVTAVIAINWGVALEGATIDPKVLTLTISGREFAVVGAGLLAALVPLSYALSMTVNLAAEPTAGLLTALHRVRAKGLQLFWMQWVVNVLALRYSPFAAILLWLAIAAAIPAAVIENLGPLEAIERQHALTAGNRMRVAALVLLLSLVALVFPLTLALAIFGANPTGAALPPLLRLVLAVPVMTVVLVPALWMLVAFTLVYLKLAGGAALHARRASNVNT